jgi:hypothetical protein
MPSQNIFIRHVFRTWLQVLILSTVLLISGCKKSDYENDIEIKHPAAEFVSGK